MNDLPTVDEARETWAMVMDPDACDEPEDRIAKRYGYESEQVFAAYAGGGLSIDTPDYEAAARSLFLDWGTSLPVTFNEGADRDWWVATAKRYVDAALGEGEG